MAESTANARNIAVLTHLGGIFFSAFPALLVWLLKKDDDPFVGEQAREALNFQVTVLLAYLISYALLLVLVGFVLVALVWMANLLLCIVAAVKASRGETWRYPCSLRLIS